VAKVPIDRAAAVRCGLISSQCVDPRIRPAFHDAS
jgi:hypothetical protein